MVPASATLGGIDLTDVESVGWEEKTGPQPYTRVFTFHKSQSAALAGIMGQPCDLVIQSDSAPTLTWKMIFPLRRVPTQKPMHIAVLCADVRWKWAREIVVRSYNIPRRTGKRHIIRGQTVELSIFKDDYQYVAGTLFAGIHGPKGISSRRKWLPREVLDDILGYLGEKCGHPWEIRSFPTGDGLAVEGLDIHHNGDGAVALAIGHAPGADLKVEKDGRVVVYSATDYEATREALKDVVPTEAGGIASYIDMKHLRPSKITVWFDKEVELRFDSVEDIDAPSETVDPIQAAANAAAAEERALMENVLPLPDPNTRIDGENFGQGSYVPIRKALEAWNAELSTLAKPRTPPTLNIANVQKYWFVLESIYTALGNLTLTADQANWSSRIATLRAHYRKTYRIPAAWMQRIRAIRPYILGVRDPVSGVRGASRAWSQYCIEPAPKTYFQAALANDKSLKFYWLNCDQYPGDSPDSLATRRNAELHTKAPSPAHVQVMDQDAGILHIEYRTDPYGMRSAIHQSLMRENGTGKLQAPTHDLKDQLKGVIAVDGRVTGAIPIGLSSDFAVAILITAMPLTPNDERRMLPYDVRPEKIPGGAVNGIPLTGGEGPTWNLICPPGLLTAWYGLLSTVPARESALRIFGFKEDLFADHGHPPGYNILNLDDSECTIHGIAVAMAVAQWAAFVNALEGHVSAHLSPHLEILGNIDALKHRLDPDGRLLTEISMGATRRPIDPMSLVPLPLRYKVLGIPDLHG